MAKEGSDYDTTSNSVIWENLESDSDICTCYKNNSDIYNHWFSDIVPEKDATKRQGYPPWKASYMWISIPQMMPCQYWCVHITALGCNCMMSLCVKMTPLGFLASVESSHIQYGWFFCSDSCKLSRNQLTCVWRLIEAGDLSFAFDKLLMWQKITAPDTQWLFFSDDKCYNIFKQITKFILRFPLLFLGKV